MADLIKRDRVKDICKTYEQITKLLDSAVQDIETAQEKFKRISKYGFWSEKLYDNEVIKDKKLQKSVKEKTWRYIIDTTGMRKLLTEKRIDELEEQVKNDETPEITPENIFGMIEKFAKNINKYMRESVCAVFEILNPTWGGYKTNDAPLIEKKAILSFYFSIDFYGNPKLNYGKRKRVQDIDNLFHMLDGRGTSKGGEGDMRLVDVIGIAYQEGRQRCETEYFECKWYQNGNLHIRFKRSDLVDRINEIAGEGYLPKKDR